MASLWYRGAEEAYLSSILERFKKELKSLLDRGQNLHRAIWYETHPDEFREATAKVDEDFDAFVKSLPNVKADYQSWYSEARAVLKQILRDRVEDFVKHYEKPKGRKQVNYESYRIEDYLTGLSVRRGGEEIVSPSAAIPHLMQQLSILVAALKRFDTFSVRYTADRPSRSVRFRSRRGGGAWKKEISESCGRNRRCRA